MSSTLSKKCYRCKIKKPTTEFYKNSKHKDKLSAWCKECERDYLKEYLEEYKKRPKNIPQFKVCSKCKEKKKSSEFYKKSDHKDGLTSYCKECVNKRASLWQQKHKKERQKYLQVYQQKNKEHLKYLHHKRYLEHREEVLKKSSEYQRKHRQEYSKYSLDYYHKKYKNDLFFSLNHRISTAIQIALNGNKNGRHWETLVGYTIKQLKQRIELNFKKGMSWKNREKWHIDHKKPKSLFHYVFPEDQAFRDCWSLANLQPLWVIDNLKKSNQFNNI